MIPFSRGDVVLVSFLFTDESGAKRRPAVVISSEPYHLSRHDVIICAVTSRTDRLLFGDYTVMDWREAGLRLPSVATGIIRTIDRNMIVSRLGKLSARDLGRISGELRLALGLRDDSRPFQYGVNE